MKTTLKMMIIAVAMLPLIRAKAQDNRMYSQYMFNALAINPAYAGNQYQLSVTALNRAQWSGIEGAPISQTLSAHYGSEKKGMGVGFIANHDKISIHEKTQLFASYSYAIGTKKMKIAFGLQAGLESVSSDYDKLMLNDAGDPNLSGVVKRMSPNFGFGLFAHSKSGYVGFSIPTFLSQSAISSSDIGASQARSRYYILTAGKVLSISQNVKSKPSFLVRHQNGSPLSYDVNNTFIFNSKIFAGVSYRSSKTVVMLMEFQLNENLRFGYAFDHQLNGLAKYGAASHEVMLNYRINLTHEPCHTYY